MSDATITPLPRVRTYARDLEEERKKRGLSAPANDPAIPHGVGKPVPQSIPVPVPTKIPKKTTTQKAAPLPANHIVAAPERPTSVSAAVLATREDEMKKAAASLPTAIPSFHDLKKLSDQAVSKTSLSRAVTSEARITITDDESGATIITDTKADRFKVAPSIFSSLKRWWARRQADRKALRAPKYVVPETERRKGIIQQATSHSGKAITDDRAQLRDQVMRRNTAPKVHEPDTTWTPNTETVFPLLEAPESEPSVRVTNVQVTPKQRGEVRTPVVPPPIVPAPVMAPTPTPAVTWDTPVVAAIIETPTPEAAPQTEPELITVEEDLVVDEDAPHDDSTKSVSREDLRTRLAVQQTTPTVRWYTTNLLSAAVVGSVVVITAVVFGVRAYLTTPDPLPTPIYEGVLISAPTINLPLATIDRATFMEALAIASDTRAVPATELFFINDGTVVAPATLLSLFSPSIDQNLAQNVRSVVFGWYNKDTPFIVLDIADKVGVWGGLLKEENTFTSTLTPFFTFPATLQGTFIDRKITTYDIRLLVDTTGNEYLAYSFINDHTVIITKNHETLLLLAALASDVK
jgi:hypothetical protein